MKRMEREKNQNENNNDNMIGEREKKLMTIILTLIRLFGLFFF